MKSTLTRNVRRTSRGKSLLMTLRLDQRYGLQGRKASKSGSRAFDRIPDSCDTTPARLRRWRSRGAQVLGDAPKVSVRQPKVRREACDAESFERMYSELRHRFHAVAYSILGNKEDAEDAVQDALISAYLHLRNFEGRSGLATWFTRIVMNASFMLLRKRKLAHLRLAHESSNADESSWTERVPAARPDPEMLYAEAETSQVVDELLSRASPVLREAFRLKHYDELSNKEGARQLGITATTFKSRVFRARQYLTKRTNYTLVAPLQKPMRVMLVSGNGPARSGAGDGE